MIRLVLDTNVLVSALFWSGVPAKILTFWRNKEIQLVFSQEILEEYTRVAFFIAQKRNISSLDDVSAVLDMLTIDGELASPFFLKEQISADTDDEKFIECALGAQCPLIVSGDKHLLDISGYAGITVLKPAEFIRFLDASI